MRNKPVRPGQYAHLFAAHDKAVATAQEVRKQEAIKKLTKLASEPFVVDPLALVAAVAAGAKRRKKVKADGDS